MLKRKMLRDLWQNRISFLAIFLMTCLGMFIYSGLNSEWNGMKISVENFYERTDMADAWIMGTNFKLEENQLQENKISYEGRTYLPAADQKDTHKTLHLYLLDTMKLSAFETTEGEPFDANADGVWLDAQYAQANQYRLGDHIVLDIQGYPLEKKIIGLVQSPEYIFSAEDGEMMPNHKMSGFCYISRTFASSLQDIPNNQLLLQTDLTKNEIHEIIEKIPEWKGSTLLMREEHPSAAMLANEVTQHQAMSTIFPFAFLFIGFLTTITTMSKLTLDQRNQIGILQALGFSNHKILMHYIAHGFLICTAGCIFGYLLGPILFPSLVYPLLEAIYTIPDLHGVPLANGWYLLLICIGIAFLVSYSTCKKQLKELPARTLRPLEPAIQNIPFLKHFNKTIKLSFSTAWNLRDIFRNALRSFMTLFGVLGCSALIFCSSGLYDTMTNLSDWMYQDLSAYETRIDLDENCTQEQKGIIKERVQGEYLYQGTIELTSGNIRKSGSLTVQESAELLHLQNTKQEHIELSSDGIMISKKIADQLNVQKGDILSWRLYGEDQWLTSKVQDIIRTPVSQGITISKEQFQTLHTFQPQSILTKETDIPNMQGIQKITKKASLTHDLDTMLETMTTMIILLISAAVILGSVVLYNLGTLSFLERQRELATLKVLGFSTSQLKHLLYQQNSWLSIAGILLGIPCGYALIYIMIITIGDSMDILIHINLPTYLYTILGTYLLSAFISLCLSRKLKTIDMVSALKSIE